MKTNSSTLLYINNLKHVILQDKKYIYLYIYNNRYILCFRVFKKTITLNLPNKHFIKLNFHKFKGLNCNLEISVILNTLLKQFCFYSSLKIKFTGKGYKIKKVSTNSMLFVFNRAHLVLLYYKNIFFKKIKKRKILIKYVGFSFYNQITPILKNIRYINTYTRRGLRISKQIIYKRRGKRT